MIEPVEPSYQDIAHASGTMCFLALFRWQLCNLLDCMPLYIKLPRPCIFQPADLVCVHEFSGQTSSDRPGLLSVLGLVLEGAPFLWRPLVRIMNGWQYNSPGMSVRSLSMLARRRFSAICSSPQLAWFDLSRLRPLRPQGIMLPFQNFSRFQQKVFRTIYISIYV